jgi:hypothetical protein
LTNTLFHAIIIGHYHSEGSDFFIYPAYGEIYMNQRVKVLLRRVLVFLTSTLTTTSPDGSGLGIYLRMALKRLNFRQ